MAIYVHARAQESKEFAPQPGLNNKRRTADVFSQTDAVSVVPAPRASARVAMTETTLKQTFSEQLRKPGPFRHRSALS
jgi:hypothetical protein